MNDALGAKIEVGNFVVFGKSDRNNPVNFGIVYEVLQDRIVILGNGNFKKSEIMSGKVRSRVFVVNKKTDALMSNALSYLGSDLEDNL